MAHYRRLISVMLCRRVEDVGVRRPRVVDEKLCMYVWMQMKMEGEMRKEIALHRRVCCGGRESLSE